MYHKLGLPVPASLYKAKNDIITTDKPFKKPPGPLIRELKHVISTLEDRLRDVEDHILPPEPRQALLDQEERPETLSPPPSALSSRYHHPYPLTPTTRRFCTKRRHVISSSNESASTRHNNQSESEEEEEEDYQTTAHVWERDEEEIKNHLFAHRKRVRFLRSCIKIQSCWRMVRAFRRFGRHKKRKQDILASHFRAWRTVFRIDKWYLKSLQHKILHNLYDCADEQVRLRQVSDISFQKSTEGGQLSLAVISLFFQSHEEAGKKALSMLTSKETLDDRWMCGVMRNILSLCINGWRLEARTLKLNRMEASMHIVKAWRLRPKGQWWLGERVHILFQVWKRMVAFDKARRILPSHQPLPTFEDEGHLVEWDEWLYQDHRKRSFVSRLAQQGYLILQHLMLTRWKSFMEHQRRQADDASFAQEHFHQALLLRCILAWDACAKERGRVLRSRVKYLRTWKYWAPINRRLRMAKAATQERVRKLRMQAVLRKWQKEILALHQSVAYRMFHLTEKYNNGSCMAIGYAWTQKRYHLTGFRCFYSWKAFSFRRQKWRRFIFLQKKMFAQHVLRVLLRGWQNVCGRRKSTKDEGKLSLEPVASMERCLGLQMAVEQGYVPETALEASHMARLICPDLLQTTNSHYPYQSSSSIFINTLHQSPQIDQLCEAVAQGDFPLIYQMLTDGIQINGITSDGTRRTALHLACSQASSDYLCVVSLLLGAGAWTNVRDAEGRTPLDLTVNAQIAALLHLHRSRLSAHEFTRDEKRHCVDLLSELWNGMSTKLLWRYVAYQLVRQRLVKIKNAITELAVPDGVLQSEWQNYNAFKEATPSSGTVEGSNGISLTSATSQPEEGDASRLPTPRESKDEDDERSGLSLRHAEGGEGDQSPVAVSNTSSMPTVTSFAKATVEDPPRLTGEVNDKLRALFPSLEQCKRFSHIITYLEKMQLFTDTTLILDSDLLDSLGIDLIRGEVNKTSWRIFFTPKTYLLETEKRRRPSDLSHSSDYPVPGSGRRGNIRYQQHDSSPPQAISSLSASLRRRSIGDVDRLPPQEHLTSTAVVNPAQMTEDEGHEWLLDTSDKWFREWSMKNAAMIQAAIKEQQHGNVLGEEPSSKAGATSHNAETTQIKALIVCSKFVEAKTQWVLQERKALLARDKCLLKQRHNPGYDYRARVPFADMIYPPKQQQQQQQQLHSTMTAGNYVWGDQQKLSVTVANVFSLKSPVLIDVAPYYSMQTHALTVSMRPSLTHSAITNAINFITTKVHTSFWSEAENSSRRRETLKYLPAGWANESYILGNLLVTFRDLKRREEYLTSEFKEINQSLYKMAKTFDEAEETENEAAEHVVEQSMYMKRKTAAIKNKLGADAANLLRSKAQYAFIKRNIESAEKALADLVMQIQATTSASRDTKEKAKSAAKSKGGKSPQPDGTPITINELLQAKATKETDLQSLQERLKLAAAAVENEILSIAKADTDREAATAKMKDLCKESLLFVYHATTMKIVYYNDRKALAEKANEVLRRVKRVRWKLQDVQRLITAIRRQVRAHRPAAASVDQRRASSKTTEDAAAAPGIDNDLDDIDLNFEQLDTHSLDVPRKGLKATTAALLLAGKARKIDRRKRLPAKTPLTSLTPSLGDEDEGPASPHYIPLTIPQQHLLEKSSLLSRAEPSSKLSVPSAEIVDRQEKEGGEMLPQADALSGNEVQQDSDRKDKEAHEEQEGEGREGEESVTTSYSYALFEDPKIMSFLQQAREKAQSDRLPKEPSMSPQTLVDEEERIPEQLYEDSLQRLFASERDQAKIKKEREKREEALKKLSADEEQEEDLLDQTIPGTFDALMAIVESANDARTPLAKEGSGLKSVVATPKTSGLFARIWQRVRQEKSLLVGMDFATGDVKVDDKLPTTKRCTLDDKSPIQESCSNERLPGWAHKSSSTGEINGDQSDDYYQRMWASDTSSSIAPSISMATPVKQLEREPPRASLATRESIRTSTKSLDESGLPSMDSSATAPPRANMSRRLTLGSFISGGTTVELTHGLLLQKTALLTLSDEDFRDLFQLVGEDDFIRSAALYLRSFDGDSSTSVFPLCSSPRSRIVSPAATLGSHLPSPASSSSSPRTIRGRGSRSPLGISIRSNGSISPSGGQSSKCLAGARGSSSSASPSKRNVLALPPSASQPSEEVAQSTSPLPAEQISQKAMSAFKSSMSRIFPLIQEEETSKGVVDDDNREKKDALIPPPFKEDASLTLPHQSPKAATLRASISTKRVEFAAIDVLMSDGSKTLLTSPSVLPQASAAVKEETESSFSSTQIHTTEPCPLIATAASSDKKGVTEEGTAVVQQRNSSKPLISLSASPRRLMDISSSFMPAAGIIDAPQQQDSQLYLASSSARTPLAVPLLPSPAGTFPMVSPFCEKQTMQQTPAEQELPTFDATITPLHASFNQSLEMGAMDIYHQLLAESPFHRTATMEESDQPSQGHEDVPAIRKVGLLRTPIQCVGRTPCHLQSATSLQQQQQQENEYGRSLRSEIRYHGKQRRQSRIHAHYDQGSSSFPVINRVQRQNQPTGRRFVGISGLRGQRDEEVLLQESALINNIDLLYNQSFPPLVLVGERPPGIDSPAKQQSSTLPSDEAAGIELERSTDEMEPSYGYYKRNADLAPRKKTDDDCSKKEVSAIGGSLNGHGVLAPSNNPRDETSHRRLTLLQQTRPSLVVDGSSCTDDMEQLSANASSSFSSASCQLSLPERRQPVSWPMVVPCRRHSKTFHSVLVQKLVEEGQQALDQRSEATKEDGQQHAGRHCSTPTKVAATSKAAAAAASSSPQVPHMLDEKERDSSSSSIRPSTTKEKKLADKSAVKGNEGESIGSSSSSFLLNAATEAKLELAMMDLLREMDEMSWAEKQNPVLAEKVRPSTNRQGSKKIASRTNKGAQRRTLKKIGEADTKLMLKGVRATA